MECPYCHRPLYSRQYKHCGYCGKVLPPECQFTKEEIAKNSEMRREMERRATAEREEELHKNLLRNPEAGL